MYYRYYLKLVRVCISFFKFVFVYVSCFILGSYMYRVFRVLIVMLLVLCLLKFIYGFKLYKFEKYFKKLFIYCNCTVQVVQY